MCRHIFGLLRHNLGSEMNLKRGCRMGNEPNVVILSLYGLLFLSKIVIEDETINNTLRTR